MNDSPPKSEALHRTQVWLSFQLTGTPHNSKTLLRKPSLRLTKYIFLHIWICGWPAATTCCFLACAVVVSNHLWHPCPIARALCRVMLPILRWPQACSNVGKQPWQQLPRYQADGLWATMWTHRRWPNQGAAQPASPYLWLRAPQTSVKGISSSTSCWGFYAL